MTKQELETNRLLDDLRDVTGRMKVTRNNVKLPAKRVAHAIAAFVAGVPDLPELLFDRLDERISDTFLIRRRYLHFTVWKRKKMALYMIDLESGAVDWITGNHDTGWPRFVSKYRKGSEQSIPPARRSAKDIERLRESRDEMTAVMGKKVEGFPLYHRATFAAKIGDERYLADVARLYRNNTARSRRLEGELYGQKHLEAMDPFARRVFLALVHHLAGHTLTRFEIVILEWAVYVTRTDQKKAA